MGNKDENEKELRQGLAGSSEEQSGYVGRTLLADLYNLRTPCQKRAFFVLFQSSGEEKQADEMERENALLSHPSVCPQAPSLTPQPVGHYDPSKMDVGELHRTEMSTSLLPATPGAFFQKEWRRCHMLSAGSATCFVLNKLLS